MGTPEERIIHCCACSRYIQLAEEAQEGDIVTCPFCHSKNKLALMTVFVGEPVEEA